MKTNAIKLIIACVGMFPTIGFAQSAVTIEGNLIVADNPLTGTENAPIKEGNLKINGSLVVSDVIDSQAVASGRNSIAAGQWVRAYGNASVAIGISYSEGYSTRAYGGHSIAIGDRAHAGDGTTVSDYALSYGFHTTAIGKHSIAIGNYTAATTLLSVAVGNIATASGYISTAIGYRANATGYMGRVWP